MNDDLVVKCLDDVIARLQSIASLKGKVFMVTNEDEAMDKIKGTSFPQACVMYEGTRALDSREQKGISCEAVFGLIVLYRVEKLAGVDTKRGAIKLLDDVRKAMRASRAPTGNHWKFIVEAQATQKDTVVIYLQRWSVPVQLV
jgi:hypothetical protein